MFVFGAHARKRHKACANFRLVMAGLGPASPAVGREDFPIGIARTEAAMTDEEPFGTMVAP